MTINRREVLKPTGEFEVPLVIQDKALAKIAENKWKLVFNDRGQRGVYADVILVNGVPWPYFKVKRRTYYFRLLNASASRTYQLVLSRTADQQTLADDQIIVG